MTIDTRLDISASGLHPLSLSPASLDTDTLFSACLTDQMAALAADPVEETVTEEGADETDQITRNTYTGFFKELQEKKMEELREKILEEMGLTEEDLARMDPEARGRVEGIIAKEIQERMMAQSAMDADEENQGLKTQMLLTEVDLLSL